MKLKNHLTIAFSSVFLASCSLNTMTFGLMGSDDSKQETITAEKTPVAEPAPQQTPIQPQETTERFTNNNTAQPSASVATPSVQKHVVVRDDTLYSIARRYDVDLSQLRKQNNIGQDNIISVGQVLMITSATVATPAKSATALPPPKKNVQEVVIEPIKKKTPPSNTTLSEAPKKEDSQPKTNSQPKPKALSAATWVWPLKGEVVRQFNPKGIGTNGIRIRGTQGQAVHATQDGVVVYKGRGLSGYGTIVILSHNNGLLSTYGFLSKTHVQEGQKVRKRETVGTVGPANDKKLALYFEVREKGDPINPMIQIGNTYRF